ncbi:MAG: hypothetical protein CL897_04750 [Dehalococcoidia bacterium]|nr:hypothetical protein [Dehalococcoidia bacterium]HCV00489.1 hypothetical protein [Dehalococcoidia bacterium]|tara:strand:- start:1625 stop:2329 length:705 start_codon:yes stop_codon:yes gene_type:complete
MQATLRAQLEELTKLHTPTAARFDSARGLHGRWAILPSAFNPPTLAHLNLLHRAKSTGGIEGAAALLTTRNVAKGVEGAGLEHRIRMLLATRKSHPGIAVLAANQARIVDQAMVLKEKWPEATFDFVLGHDTLIRLFDERYYEGPMEELLDPFFQIHRVFAASRGEVTIGEMEEWLTDQAPQYAKHIVTIELDKQHRAIASSEERSLIRAGQESNSLPAEVVAYIREHSLYSDT